MDERWSERASEIAEFVRGYGPVLAGRVRFAWNGKHGGEFADENQEFRFRVVEQVCANPGEASLALLATLFVESAAWAREAWCTPGNFVELAAELLARGGEEVLPEFLSGFRQSFDTFGACHQMKLDPVLTRRLLQVTQVRAAAAREDEKASWEAGSGLFSSLLAGTAAQGWVEVRPGTPVSAVRRVPRWELRARGLWNKLRALVGLGRT